MVRDREPTPMAQTRIEALTGNIDAVREGKQITPEAISSLYHSSRAVAQDVMRLDSVESTLFAMRFGTMLLASAIFKDIVVIEHLHDNLGTTTHLVNNPSELRKTVSSYLWVHFSFYPFPDPPYKSRLIEDVHERFSHAGITTDYVDTIYYIAENMVSDLCTNHVQLNPFAERGIDKSKLTVQYFSESARKIPEQPNFILEPEKYPQFMAETSIWLHERFEAVLDNIITGKYLAEQEMN